MKQSNRPLYRLIAMLLILITGFYMITKKAPLTPAEQSAYSEIKPGLVQKADYYSLRPDGEVSGGVIIFPDSMEDPASYAPMAKKLAEQGFEIRVVKYPLGFIQLSGAHRKILEDGNQLPWVSLGFGQGSDKACSLADKSTLVAGLILTGICASKVNLNDNDVQVKVYQLADQPYPVDQLPEIRKRLPADTEFITVETIGEMMAEIPGEPSEMSITMQQQTLVSEIKEILMKKVVNLRNKK